MGRPTFTPLADGQEYSVLVTWEDGGVSRIRHFGAIHDAQRWIDRESLDWLRAREEQSHGYVPARTSAAVTGFRTRVLKAPT